MCLTKITYYSCNCMESKREILCPLPRPACPEKLKYPETRILPTRCPAHDTWGFTKKRGSPTEADRWSPIKPGSLMFEDQPIEITSLYPSETEPDPHWSALPPRTVQPSGSGRSGNGSGGRGRVRSSGRRQSKPLVSARIEDALGDLEEMNMPVRKRESMVGLFSLREHEARQMAEDAPPVPPLPTNLLHRTGNVTKVKNRQYQHTPPAIDTSLWHSSAKRTQPQRQNSGGVTKPFSPKSRISPRTAALAQQQATIREYRENLCDARHWVASLYGPWTRDAFFSQPCIAALNNADRQMLWSELHQRAARGQMQRDRGRWGDSGQDGYGSHQVFEDQSHGHRHARSKKSSRKEDSSSGCLVM